MLWKSVSKMGQLSDTLTGVRRQKGYDMNRRDIGLVVLVLFAAAASLVWMITQEENGSRVEIAVEGELFGVYDLSEDQTITIGNTNTCRIENGEVWMEWADCPDQLCVHQKKISSSKETVVCLPNRVTLTIVGKTSEEENQPDIIAS